MSGYSSLGGADVRRKLGHPVIGAEAHIVECNFALMDCLKEVAEPEVAAPAEKAFQNAGSQGSSV